MVYLSALFINYLLDYPLQGDFLSNNKGQSFYILFIHSVIWGLGLSIFLFHVGLFAWWKMVFLVIGHFVIDGWKARGHYKKMGLTDRSAYLIDQILHLIQLVVVLV
jgi:hypothetical protein